MSEGTNTMRREVKFEDDLGFHWRDGWYFQKLADGSVRISRTVQSKPVLIVEDTEIPPNEWASIVEFVS